MGVLVMQHLRVAAASVSVVASFVVGLFAHHDAAPIHSEPIPVVPTSCQQALTQGAHLVLASVTGESQLLDALGANPSQLPDLLDSYGRTLSQLNQRLPTYTVAWRQCERSIG